VFFIYTKMSITPKHIKNNCTSLEANKLVSKQNVGVANNFNRMIMTAMTRKHAVCNTKYKPCTKMKNKIRTDREK